MLRGVAKTLHVAANTATFTAFTSFLAVFLAFLGAKQTFFQKVIKKWSSIQKN